MTGEQLHDALTLLPGDLIAQADEARSRKPSVIRWKQLAAMAACFALLICSAVVFYHSQQKSSPTDMAAAAPFAAMQEEAAADTASGDTGSRRMEAAKGVPETSYSNAAADSAIAFTCVETPYNLHTTACYAHGPCATAIASREELDAYLSKWDRLYLLDNLRDACEIYDDGWFASHDLLLIPVDGVSAGQTCVISDMTLQDGACAITIALTGEETGDSTNYHVVVPAEKGAVSDAGQITVHLS